MRNPLPDYIRTAPLWRVFLVELAVYMAVGVIIEIVDYLWPGGDDQAMPLWAVPVSVGLVMSIYHTIQRRKQRQQDRHDEPRAPMRFR